MNDSDHEDIIPLATGHDEYGVPDNMFGFVDEAFYATIGRVVMVTTVLEQRLLDLLDELRLHSAPQPTDPDYAKHSHGPDTRHHGQPGKTLIDLIEGELDWYSTEYAQLVSRALEAAAEAIDERNQLAHSLWPGPTLESAYGHRPVLARKRGDDGVPYKAILRDRSEIRDQVATTAALVGTVDHLRARAAGARQTNRRAT